MSNVTKFQDAKTKLGKGLKLIGDALLVEAMPEREVKIGSIIASAGKSAQLGGVTSNLPIFVRVLLTGEGYYDDATGEDVPLDIKAGNILQVGRQSVDFFGSFGSITTGKEGGVGMCRTDAARMVFEDEAAYNSFFEDISK